VKATLYIRPLLGILIALASLGIAEIAFQTHGFLKPEQQQQLLQNFIRQREIQLDEEAATFSIDTCLNFSKLKEFPSHWNDLAIRKNIGFIGYSDSDIHFWTDNSISVSSIGLQSIDESSLLHLKNGWYFVKRYQTNACQILGFALVCREYSYQNDYLQNGYPHLDELSITSLLTSTQELGALPILNSKGKISAWFQPGIENSESDSTPLWPIVLAVWGIFLFLISMHQIANKLAAKKGLIIYLYFWIFLVTLRIISFSFGFPSSILHLSLFSPNEYAASNWLPTLGDLLINSLIFLYSAWLIHQKGKQLRSKNKFNFIQACIALVFLFGIAAFIEDTIRGLVINSSISLDISDVFNLTLSSYISFFIIGVLFAALFLIMERISEWLSERKLSLLNFISILSISGFIIGIPLYIKAYDLGGIIAAFLLFLLIYFSRTRISGYNYARVIAIIIGFAIWGTYLLLHFTSEREFEKRKLLAAKISADRDPIAESLFLEVENKILNDSILRQYMRPSTIAPGQVRDLAQLYFHSYWEKYSINVQVFGADECPMTALYTTSISDPIKFDRLIDSIGIPTLSDRFFFIDNGSGRISYLARLPILNEKRDSIPLGTLYIDFQSRYTPEEIGYPELLLDKMVSTRTDLSNYSYARYNNGNLVSHYGNFSYELTDSIFRNNSIEEYHLIKDPKFSHLVYRVRPESYVILSLPKPSILGVLTPFSYLILFFSILFLLPYLGYEIAMNRNLKRISFKRRIQLSIVLILFISLILIGGGTILYIISNSNQKNLKNISEKIHSLLVETDYLIGKEVRLNPFISEDITYELTKQANIFFADVNIFDPTGQLYASSRSKIFDEGLVSKKMNPEAYYNLAVRKKTEFIQEEHIGKLNYFSAYVPIRNFENTVIGYLNLPYFARQNELRKEIVTFIIAIVNIYVLLIVLVLIAAIFLSNTITEPLRLIQEKLSNIQLGRKNEVIAWKGKDEIGDLINEYNRMVSELAESADKLARSERESAWREMAKQVAHEIKNPLTPMKLSTQMLKRAWDDDAPGFNERIARYTQNLIEQIDSLSHIATEFSNFAKMPNMVKEKVDIHSLLLNAIDLHQGEQGVNITLDVDVNALPCYVNTDKEQMLRVFNNLFRNAIQSIPENRMGELVVQLKSSEKEITLSIQDNGTGISDELRDKIFSPNFTTKNSGMGLGLALVKNIIVSSDGEIWFESTVNVGTTFFISLPVFIANKEN
jgi:signal transduction histidine kinase